MSLSENWEFDVLGVYNYRQPGPLRHYVDYIVENHAHIEGDILEAGVFRGRSLLSVALLLRELGSDKKVYGYDSFAGFPPAFREVDELSAFDALFEQGRIREEHYENVKANVRYRSFQLGRTPSPADISSSADFADASVEALQQKIEFLGLDNISLVPGPFDATMNDGASDGPSKVFAALLDCDLYTSYWAALPFVWNRLSQGGYVFLDEYYSLKFPGARIATDEFFEDRPDKPQMHRRAPGDFERWFVRKLHGSD